MQGVEWWCEVTKGWMITWAHLVCLASFALLLSNSLPPLMLASLWYKNQETGRQKARVLSLWQVSTDPWKLWTLSRSGCRIHAGLWHALSSGHAASTTNTLHRSCYTVQKVILYYAYNHAVRVVVILEADYSRMSCAKVTNLSIPCLLLDAWRQAVFWNKYSWVCSVGESSLLAHWSHFLVDQAQQWQVDGKTSFSQGCIDACNFNHTQQCESTRSLIYMSTSTTHLHMLNACI